MNKDLTETMALNLAKNAIAHNQNGAEIIIRLALRILPLTGQATHQ